MPSDTESSISGATSRNTTLNSRRLPDLPSWGPLRPQHQQSQRGRIESSMSVASAASTGAGPYSATLRPTTIYNDGARKTSSYENRTGGRQMGHSGLEHPGMKNRQSFTLLAKQDLERAEVFAIIHRSTQNSPSSPFPMLMCQTAVVRRDIKVGLPSLTERKENGL